jgi:hypothetical protein
MANVLPMEKRIVDTDDPKKPKRHVTVLHIAPILSAEAAVKAAIVQELRSLEPTEEE